jgi:hypothetical protein
MSDASLKSSAKRSTRRKAPPGKGRSVERIGRQEMIARRDRCILAIAGCRDEPNANMFFLKARTLLTRHWYPASWRSRGDILRNAEWLVRLGEKYNQAQPIHS